MSKAEILEALKKLPAVERLRVIESALHLLSRDLPGKKEVELLILKKTQMAEAAKTLLSDYTSDSELTSFTALDGEGFRA